MMSRLSRNTHHEWGFAMIRERKRGESGFTLLELIMVIVIIGILAAVIVPKYFDITTEAEESVEESFLGSLKSAIHTFGSDRLLETGARYFPKVQSPLFTRVMGEIPSDWSYTQSNGKIDHTRSNGHVESWYYYTNYDSTQFEIKKTFSGPPPPP